MKTFFVLCYLTYRFSWSIEILRYPPTDPQPDPRKFISMNGVHLHNYFMFFGGYNNRNKLYSDIWNFDLSTVKWSQSFSLDGTSPSKRYLVARYSGGGYWNYLTDEYCIFGGMSARGQLNDLWCFDLTNFLWRSVQLTGDYIKPRYRFGSTNWNETDTINNTTTVMFAILGGITIENTSQELYLVDTTSNVVIKQNYSGDVPGAQEGANIFYSNGYIYMIGGVSTYDAKPYVSKFFRYNLAEQKWENITNSDYIFKYRNYAQGRVHNNTLYLFPGEKADKSGNEASIWAVSLLDETFAWYEVQVVNDTNKILSRNSYGISHIGNNLFMFGGETSGEVRNDFIKFDLSSNPLNFSYFPAFISPTPRQYHSLTLVGGYLFLFGGDHEGKKLNDLWRLDVIEMTWLEITPGGTIPIPRSHHACSSYGDVMAIFGGIGEFDYLNDVYLYNSLTNMWYQIESPSTIIPSIRAGTCLDIRDHQIVMYGGETRSGLSDEIWGLDLGTQLFTLFDSGNEKGPGPLTLSSCRFSTSSPFFYVFNGITITEVPSNGYYIFNMTSNKWITTYKGPTNPLYDRADIKDFKCKDFFIYIGGSIYNTPSYTLTYFDMVSKKFTNFAELPDYIYAAGQTYFGNSYYSHGGGKTIGKNLRRTIPTGILLKINLISVCKDYKSCNWKCSPGSYPLGNLCVSCPAGTYQPYFDQTGCKKCPPGTYYPGTAGINLIQCYPCNEGTYSSAYGADRCMYCPVNTYCPAGSISYSNLAPKFSDTSIQPNLLKEKTSIASNYSTYTSIAAGVFGFFIIVLLIIIARHKDILVQLDLYNDQHNYLKDVPMVLTNTKVGGFFSIVFMVLAAVTIASTLISFIEDNILEVKTLVPLVVMDETVSVYKTNLNVSLTLINYGAPCIDDNKKCADTIGFKYEYFTGTWQDPICTSYGRNCEVFLSCDDCVINSGAYLFYQFTNRSSFSSGFTANVTSTSSVPETVSSYQTSLLPSSQKVFRGEDYCSMFFDLTPSYFQNKDSGLDLTGYHISKNKDSEKGSEFLTNELAISYNLYFKINFIRNSNCLITTRSSKNTVFLLISGLLGSVFGLMGTVGGVMSFVESKLIDRKAKKEAKKSKKNIFFQSDLINSIIGFNFPRRNSIDTDLYLSDSELIDSDLYKVKRRTMSNERFSSVIE